jgi:hypothetical protein
LSIIGDLRSQVGIDHKVDIQRAIREVVDDGGATSLSSHNGESPLIPPIRINDQPVNAAEILEHAKRLSGITAHVIGTGEYRHGPAGIGQRACQVTGGPATNPVDGPTRVAQMLGQSPATPDVSRAEFERRIRANRGRSRRGCRATGAVAHDPTQGTD